MAHYNYEKLACTLICIILTSVFSMLTYQDSNLNEIDRHDPVSRSPSIRFDQVLCKHSCFNMSKICIIRRLEDLLEFLYPSFQCQVL